MGKYKKFYDGIVPSIGISLSGKKVFSIWNPMAIALSFMIVDTVKSHSVTILLIRLTEIIWLSVLTSLLFISNDL